MSVRLIHFKTKIAKKLKNRMEKDPNNRFDSYQGFNSFQEQNINFNEDVPSTNSQLDVAQEISNEEFLQKINLLQPESGIGLYKKLIEKEEKPHRLYPFFLKKPYSWALENENPSLFLFISTQLFPKDFEPQDVYEVYSIENYRRLTPIAAQLAVLSTIFTLQTHMIARSKLFGLTAENCYRTKFFNFVFLPIIGFKLAQNYVHKSTKEELYSYINKYDIN